MSIRDVIIIADDPIVDFNNKFHRKHKRIQAMKWFKQLAKRRIIYVGDVISKRK